MRIKKWNPEQLKEAAKNSTSIRQILDKIGLIQAGGNYNQIKKYLLVYNIDTSHFKGRAWNKGMRFKVVPKWQLNEILVENSTYQSHKLKNRLLQASLKKPVCEECGWAKKSEDGRIPLELDHINGNNKDNRLENLRILCPNCHSLKPTHRGCNRK